MKRILLSAICFSWAGVSFASDPITSSLWLKCAAVSENAVQPCGGKNTKEVTIAMTTEITPNGQFIYAQAYNGCYPVRDKFFGIIENIKVSGSVVSFAFKSTGSFSFLEDIPEVDPIGWSRVINASYDANSKLLTITSEDLPGYYQNPNVLKCKDIDLYGRNPAN